MIVKMFNIRADIFLVTAIATGNGVAKSPFIIAMNRLDIPFLPDLCNALV